MAIWYNTSDIDNYLRWKKPDYGYPRYGAKRGNAVGGYNTYMPHNTNRYSIPIIYVIGDDEIENEIEINICCTKHLDISKKKYDHLLIGCLKQKTFIVPRSVKDEQSFFDFIKGNAVSLR